MDRNIHHINENHCPVNIYLNFSKAFDSLIYDILLSKLKHYGIQQNALQLLSSFLKDRIEYVQLSCCDMWNSIRLCFGSTSFSIFI